MNATLNASPSRSIWHSVSSDIRGPLSRTDVCTSHPSHPCTLPMATPDNPLFEISPQMLLRAYACGIFPMAESADDPQLYWIEPQSRGVLPLDGVTVHKRLARTVRREPYQVRIDTDFEAVIDGCAASRPGRRSTWINAQIRSLYRDLYRQGHCHTVEVWDGSVIVGGLYGVALGGAFFGESMFSIRTDASKIALVYLCARLIHGGFSLLDTQFVTEHLKQFGTVEVEKAAFHVLLDAAIEDPAAYLRLPADTGPLDILRLVENARFPVEGKTKPRHDRT